MSRSLPNASPIVYRFLRGLFRFLGWLLFRQEVYGLENIPASGPFLVVVNHLGIADPPLVFINVQRQMVVFAADKWKKVPGIRQLLEAAGVIWVARGEADLSAIKAALAVLKSGRPLGMAPEGTRSRTHALQRGKTGAAYLADRTGVPIVPIGISGSERLAENLRRLRRTPVRLVVGKPFYLPPNGRASGDLLEAYTTQIMCRIAALLPPEYRGVYADHPQLRELLTQES
ncbi:MAG: lysophospholipid acyltransferase family protein [Anaerolineales bacterium]|nr:lysophospholipid acyltransferase family protein [Anaerolineales bacterium]